VKEKEKVVQQFGKNKDAYITSTTHGNQDDLEDLMAMIDAKENMVALDVATRGGHVAKSLARNVSKVVATDLTEEMLRNTASHLSTITNIEFIVADAEDLPFEENSFDIITCRYAAHHFPHPKKFVQEVYRTLKPGGKFLFVDNVGHENSVYDNFINKLDKIRDTSHVRSLKISEWKKMFDSFGLEVLQQKTRNKTLPFMEWVTRTLDNPKAIQLVTDFMLQAPNEVKKYYHVKLENNKIISFTLDEWVALCKK